MQYELTIIVPLFNEMDCLLHLKDEMNKFLNVALGKVSILFVNDGSTDKSQSIIESICREDSRYHFIQFKENRGLSTALKAGFDHCETTLVGYIDADLQTSPMDFLMLLELIEDCEAVIGIRAKRNDNITKRLSSNVANTVRRWLINDGISDTGCPLKIIKTKNAKDIPFFVGMHRFIPALIQLQGGRIKQIPIQHFPRFAGTAKYTLWNRLIGPFVDALAFRWMKKRYIRYTIVKQG